MNANFGYIGSWHASRTSILHLGFSVIPSGGDREDTYATQEAFRGARDRKGGCIGVSMGGTFRGEVAGD